MEREEKKKIGHEIGKLYIYRIMAPVHNIVGDAVTSDGVTFKKIDHAVSAIAAKFQKCEDSITITIAESCKCLNTRLTSKLP